MARQRERGSLLRRRWRSVVTYVVVTALLTAGVWWLLTSPVFHVKKVESSRYRFTAKSEVDEKLWSWTERKMNIWTLDTDSLCRELEAKTWIRRARLTRRLPATLRVDIWEWRPELLVAPAGDAAEPSHALVQNGDTLPLPTHLPPPDLPLLVNGEGATTLDAAGAQRLLALLEAIRETGLETVHEVDFVLRDDTGLTVVLAGNRVRLVVGREDFAVRLQRYLGVADRVPAAAVVDLRFQRQVYIEETT